jgi:tRNA pseudouridine55 synthase
MIDGILIIDKPEGITSHDVVARCRRILKTKRIGHTGTLDPFATGVMVVLVGKATRLAQFLDKDAKEYEALVRFGFETDTGDRTGEIRESSISNSEFQISNEAIEDALQDFRGEIQQTPPMYSAKKIDGKKLYELARKGIEIERQPVKIKIHELELLESKTENQKPKTEDRKPKTEDQDPKTADRALRVLCSAGTYIRVLAEDIGKKLQTGAHLAELRRTKAGRFGIEKSVTLEKLEEIFAENTLAEVLISPNEAVSHLAEIKLSVEETARIKNGVKLKYTGNDLKDGEFLRLTENGNLLAIGFYDAAEKIVQPRLVLV